MSAINAQSQRAAASNPATCPGLTGFRAAALLIVLLIALFSAAGVAHAGQAAIGEPVFYPCTGCHPVAGGKAVKPLPIDFEGHRVKLEVHDKLGKGSAACLVCHDDPARDPGKLKLVDGTLVDITKPADVAKVCYRCHSEKYEEWTQGVHGKRAEKCSAAGCHDPHTPSWIYAEPLLPFVGTGFQTRAVSERAAFTPLASAPVPVPVHTPWWLSLAAGMGAVVSAGLIGFIVMGRRTR